MSVPVIAGFLWVLGAAATAMLPYRRQFRPGLLLLVLAPVLLVWIGIENGWLAAALATLGFVSMFRNPLIHLWRRTLGPPARGAGEAGGTGTDGADR